MKRKSMRWPTVVDLFCGCGGVTEGLKRSNFRVVAAVDNDPIACKTYRQNHGTVELFESDIKSVSAQEIRRNHLFGKDLDLLVICAPCQPFSGQNRKSGEDARAHLILDAIRFAKALRPTIIFFENVPGLTRRQFAPLLKKLREGLHRAGYILSVPKAVDAADYGVPQRRLRCIMLAQKGGLPPDLPAPITPSGARKTVAKAIRNLPSLEAGEASGHDPFHFARNHQPIALKRLALIPKDGGGREALPRRLQLLCHKDHKGHPDVYGRMRWNDVAPTLTTGCTDITRGRFVHPEDDRAITIREAARLQTFPDDYHFEGTPSDIATQIGNAVPVRLIEALAPVLRSVLRS